MSVPGIRPLNPPYPRKVADALAAMMPANVAPLRLFRTFARNLPMPQAMQPLGRYELSADLSLWRALASVLDEAQRLDLLLSGWYHAVCFAASAARAQLEDHGPESTR
jgi:hypothetical protein